MAKMLKRACLNSHVLVSQCYGSRISLPLINRRNFKTSGFTDEWTKEKRTELDWKFHNRSRPMDFDNPLTWIGLITPMAVMAYSIYMINKLYIEKTEEEEQKEKEVIRAISHRDPKLKVRDL